MTIFYLLDLFGTLVFAISGVLAAVEKKFDLVGAFVLGTVTAIGGGTLRDILIGETPVAWMKDPNYLYAIFFSLPLCFFFRNTILGLRKSLFLFDSIGIALFTIIGLEKTLALGLSPLMAIAMGIVSAVFGGILRDVLSNEVPLIFRKEIYATACLIGAIAYLALNTVMANSWIPIVIAMIVVFLIRYFSVVRKWSIPFNPLNSSKQ